MAEEQKWNRTLNGPECLATLRRIALNIMLFADDKNSLEGQVKVAAISEEYLLGLLLNAVSKFWKRRPQMYNTVNSRSFPIQCAYECGESLEYAGRSTSIFSIEAIKEQCAKCRCELFQIIM